MKALECSPKVLALRHPKKESVVEFQARAEYLHKQLCPEPKDTDMIEVAPGFKLPRKIVEAAKEVGDYMDLHYPGPWKLCGIQKREP